jgi:glycosyltransferase involved in cell wall biosynthesis
VDKLSVIVTARNAEKTIRVTLKSLMSSIRKHDEILILLDACTDTTGDIAASVCDSRIKIFEHKSGLGRSRGRNFLIDKSDSTFLAICDADDLSLPWRFNLARQLLVDYDAVFGTAIVFGKTLRPLPVIPQIPRKITSEQMPLELLGRNPLVHSTATFKRSVFEEVGLYRDSEAEEYDLWLRMVNANKFLYRSAMPVALYRFHPSQASKSPGFVQRGLECRYVIAEQKKLAERLGLVSASIEGIRELSRERVKKTGFRTKLEVQGLPSFMTRNTTRK